MGVVSLRRLLYVSLVASYCFLVSFSAAHAAVLFSQSDTSQVMVVGDPVNGVSSSCYEYSVQANGDVESVTFSAKAPTNRFVLVRLQNLTRAQISGKEANFYTWEFAPNNYEPGVSDGTGSMELYRVAQTHLHNFYGNAEQFSVSVGDVMQVCLGAYPTPQVFPKAFSYLEMLGDGALPAITLESIDVTPLCTENCNSNVLFLPGLQGSALVSGGDTLWPPSVWSTDVARLAVSESGESIEDVRVAGVLGDFYGTDIYASFGAFMDGLVAEGVLEEWVPFAYDWRLPLERTLYEGVLREGQIEPAYLISHIESLAATSRTGKVTLITHSMGGLLGKLLIQELGKQGKTDLIDAFVMVGTPQLGTPQGIASLLHGDQQGIAGGILVKASTVRDIAQNMESAYTLLPSNTYFAEVTEPVITFNTADAFTTEWVDRWGTTIDSFNEFEEFVTGTGVVRTSPDTHNLHAPEVLRTDIMSSASDIHGALDTYTFPESIRVVEIVGWGRPTVKSLTYSRKHNLYNSYVTDFTIEGDKTVIYPSATRGEEAYFFNLFDFNELFNGNIEHRDLLNAEPIQIALQSLITKEDISADFIFSTKPSTDVDRLLVSTRSPLLLGVYDESGRFTGIRPTDKDSDVKIIYEDIPGSTFISTGEDQHIFLPERDAYSFSFIGTDSGPATVEIQRFSNNTAEPVSKYSDIEITAETQATFTVDAAVLQETTLQIDKEGDGVVDTWILPDGYETTPTLAELIASLRAKIETVQIKDKLKAKLLKKVEQLEKRLHKKKPVKASATLVNIERKIMQKSEKGKISTDDVAELLDMLSAIERAL